jgi:hypothetical protein
LASALAQTLAMHRIDVPPITVQHVATIPKTAAGKAPLIRSNLKLSASYVSQPSYDFLKG